MPALTNNPIFTAVDVQAALIAKLNADPYVQSVLLDGTLPTAGQNVVLDDDPNPRSVAFNEKTRCVLTLSTEAFEDATLGREGGGTADLIQTYTLVYYIYDGDNRVAEHKPLIITNTNILRMAIMRYSQGTGIPAGGTQQVQLWYDIRFQQGVTTTYYTPKECRMSITLVQVRSRLPFT